MSVMNRGQILGGAIGGAAIGYAQAECAKQATERNTAALRIREQLEALSARVRMLADRAENSLYSVSMPSTPEPTNKLGECNELFPPLFAEYRQQISDTCDSIRRIESVLDRLEV